MGFSDIELLLEEMVNISNTVSEKLFISFFMAKCFQPSMLIIFIKLVS